MRCLQCQIGNHDNCLYTIPGYRHSDLCLCWECGEADKVGAKARWEKRRAEYTEELRERLRKSSDSRGTE